MMSIIKKNSLADEVGQRLRQKISDGEYAIGEKLPSEPELMAVFGVGRSTIREAVKNLSNSGFVRVQQGLGTFVEERQAAPESLTDRIRRAKGLELNEMRQLLELKIAEKAARNRTVEDISKMKRHLEIRQKMALANIPDQCIQADIDFHLATAAASQSQILEDLYKTIAHHLQLYFLELYIDTESFVHTQEMHESLFQSIIDQKEQDAWEWAARITRQHY